jgi:catechol 2,3-dioxygenase-like lactoylglutathione lyase family enzyme
MGWWTETPITDLEFGTSKLKVVVYRGPDGVQVQGYERLEPPLPEAIGPFERLSKPFNMMQMVRDRDASYDFYTQLLGFHTFYKGKPYLATEPEFMPLGIPRNLTTEIPYRAGIVSPVPGEFGRMETIEIMGLEGRDHAKRCHAPNLGILAVRFPVEDAADARALVLERGGTIDRDASTFSLPPYGEVTAFDLRTPDGALVQFFEPLTVAVEGAPGSHSEQSTQEKILRIKRSTLLVHDLQRSIDFYTQVLGLELFDVEPDYVTDPESYGYPLFNIPQGARKRMAYFNTSSEVRGFAIEEVLDFEWTVQQRPRAAVTLFETSDIAGLEQRLRDGGYTVWAPSHGENYGKIFAEIGFLDPDGHLLAAYQYFGE